METKIIKKFFGLADFLDEQKFLEEQHSNGWKFKKFQWLRKYTFERLNEKTMFIDWIIMKKIRMKRIIFKCLMTVAGNIL